MINKGRMSQFTSGTDALMSVKHHIMNLPDSVFYLEWAFATQNAPDDRVRGVTEREWLILFDEDNQRREKEKTR
jgi:hypothetical protein